MSLKMFTTVKCLVLILLSIQSATYGFYMQHVDAFNEDENNTIIDKYELKYNHLDGGYPNEFNLLIRAFGGIMSMRFLKIKNQSADHDCSVFTTVNSRAEKHAFSKVMPFQSYVHEHGDGIVTLMKNTDLLSRVYYNNEYRLIGSIFERENSIAYDILPALMPRSSRRRRDVGSYYTHEQYHTVHKRDTIEFGMDFIDPKTNKDFVVAPATTTEAKNKPTARVGVNGQPVQLYVELVLVADYTVYLSHQGYAKSTNKELVLLHMRNYFAHMVNVANQRYVNSFSIDSDLRLSVKLKGLIVHTTLQESSWSYQQATGTNLGSTYTVASPTLQAFRTYMNRLSLPFSFDHAVGMFNKEFRSDSGGSIAGLSPIGGICNSYKYSLALEKGGFFSINIIAHELGHNLGSFHDGDGSYEALAASCQVSENYIMTPGIGFYQTNLLNLFRFSRCSVAQFKKYLLATDLRSASTNAQCLTNVPTNLPIETSNPNIEATGRIWTADDQCKMIFGNNASFCHATSSTVCTTLSCRSSMQTTYCSGVNGIGAADYTPCESGKSCFQGECVTDTDSPSGNCIHGDDYVSAGVLPFSLPKLLMTCDEAIAYMLTMNRDFVYHCQKNPNFASVCCKTCETYKSMTCADQLSDCSQYSQLCNSGSTLNGVNINQQCPMTCGTCQRQPLSCFTSASMCQNGAVCKDKASSSGDLLGFNCDCLAGYSGQFCENKNSCMVNDSPCKNGGSCQLIGSTSYACLCLSGFTGFSCETSLSTNIATSIFATSSSTQTSSSSITTQSTSRSTLATTKSVTVSSTTKFNPCTVSTCSGYGLCFVINGVDPFCLCYKGRTGNRCESEDVQNCTVNTCNGNGLCFILRNSPPKCICFQGRTGSRCEITL